MASVMEAYERHINPAAARLFRLMGMGSTAVRAEGCYVYDEQGREYIDFLGNFGVLSLGHRHPRIIASVLEQLNGLAQTARFLLDKPAASLAEALAGITPGDLQYCFFCNSGAEAVEAAIKIARLATGKSGFIATINGFHGKTFGALSVSGREPFRAPFLPLLPRVIHVPFGDAAAFEKALGEDPDIAAFIVEPVQGEGGVNVPPRGYLKEVEALCRQAGVLLIADEVQTGLGRTGRLFACDEEGVVPDLLCLAKALGGGVMPIGAVVGRPAVWEALSDHPWLHTSTFGGNPLACAAALAAIEVTIEEDLMGHARQKGDWLLSRLKELASRHERVIADVRGRGLLIGMELTKEGAGGWIISRMVEERIIVGYTLNNPRVIRLEPPLNVPREALERVFAVLERAVREAEEFVEDL
ncbi:aminotransferase class III-fold pyridoxal phosphate-dependent enzyme [Heliobacterium undosum]|uniref:Aminotransferase class III-fold pyridoxal phosphate-dependent enzyme n=1 Tax=Heliomicrobium undosum TaxID=121734 RepID=A0A845L084_9FIRM|nr:aminotransferase class III-fold pyridoxal phosphate-dependent enzyme [Heliomicrobium undosum]MZP28124.1 aminotransferase class III-fold pyridoxal phosphate-dependent enzyme [Heliomicrobium undosum]